MEKKDNKRNAGDLKKTELKKNSVPFLVYFNWSLSVKAVNDDSYRNESERKLFTVKLHDYDVKRSNFTFYGVPERKSTIFISFSKLWPGPLEFNPKKDQHLANWTRWNKGDLGIKFETQRECNEWGGGGGGAGWYGNGPLSWGNPPVRIISHFNLITFTW